MPGISTGRHREDGIFPQDRSHELAFRGGPAPPRCGAPGSPDARRLRSRPRRALRRQFLGRGPQPVALRRPGGALPKSVLPSAASAACPSTAQARDRCRTLARTARPEGRPRCRALVIIVGRNARGGGAQQPRIGGHHSGIGSGIQSVRGASTGGPATATAAGRGPAPRRGRCAAAHRAATHRAAAHRTAAAGARRKG